MRLRNYNEIVYSYVAVLFSENKYDVANDVLKLVKHLLTLIYYFSPYSTRIASSNRTNPSLCSVWIT